MLSDGEPTPADRLRARLTLLKLFNDGWANRLPYFELGREKGGIGYVYGLSDKAVAEFGGKTFDEHSRRTLDHELEISFFHIATRKFAETQGFEPYWQQSDLKRGIHPDALLKLTKEQGETRFFLEIEKSKNSKYIDGEPNIIRKLARYAEYYDTDECLNDWGFNKFRVIVVQTNDTRRQNLLKVLRDKLNHRMFWLTTEELYKSDISGPVFETPKDDSHNTYSLLSLY